MNSTTRTARTTGQRPVDAGARTPSHLFEVPSHLTRYADEVDQWHRDALAARSAFAGRA